MNLVHNARRQLIRCFACSLALGLPIFAGSSVGAGENLQAEPLASLSDWSGPYWTPHVAYERLTLRVSGPAGLLIQAEFGAGEAPYLAQRLPDGSYNYELRAIPVVDARDRERLLRARAAGDDSIVADLRAARRLPQGPTVQSGSFSIRAGALVDPTVVE